MLFKEWFCVSCILIVWLCDRLLVVVSSRLFMLVSFMNVFSWLLSVRLRCVILVSLWVISVVCVFSFRFRLFVVFVVMVRMFLIVLFIFMLMRLLFVYMCIVWWWKLCCVSLYSILLVEVMVMVYGKFCVIFLVKFGFDSILIMRLVWFDVFNILVMMVCGSVLVLGLKFLYS